MIPQLVLREQEYRGTIDATRAAGYRPVSIVDVGADATERYPGLQTMVIMQRGSPACR